MYFGTCRLIKAPTWSSVHCLFVRFEIDRILRVWQHSQQTSSKSVDASELSSMRSVNSRDLRFLKFPISLLTASRSLPVDRHFIRTFHVKVGSSTWQTCDGSQFFYYILWDQGRNGVNFLPDWNSNLALPVRRADASSLGHGEPEIRQVHSRGLISDQKERDLIYIAKKTHLTTGAIQRMLLRSLFFIPW